MNTRDFGIASGFGGLGAGLAGMLFGGGENPYDAAKGFYNRIPGATQPYYNPYMQAGQGALGQLQGQYGNLLGGLPGLQSAYGQMAGMGQGVMGQYGQLMNDPSAMYSKIASGYQQSPGFKWELGQGMNAANNAAAAGGMIGSPQHQQQAATMAEGLANQDFQNYMQKALGLYGQGLSGAANMYGAGIAGQQGLYNQGLAGEQGINQMGFNANDQMARIMADMMSQQGQMSFAGQAAQNQQQGQEWGNIFGGLASLAAFL